MSSTGFKISIMLFELHFKISFECPCDRCAVVNKTIIDIPHGSCYISKNYFSKLT